MSKYQIEINYQTGNSFGHEDKKECLELKWNNIDVAKENLKRIRDHYRFNKSIQHSYSSQKENIELANKASQNDWFVNEKKLWSISQDQVIDKSRKKKFKPEDLDYRIDIDRAERCLKLKADNGNTMQISAFWTGYFEKLHGAKIIMNEGENDMEFSFD